MTTRQPTPKPSNEAIAQLLEEIGHMMELLGEDSFRISAHTRAARAIADLGPQAASMSREELLAIPGVGQKIADKVIELCTTGHITEHDELRAKVPTGLLDVLQVPGLGPKTVRVMWTQAGITDITSLKKAIDDGSLLTLPRMGQKAVDKIKAALAFAATSSQRLWLGRAWAVADSFVALLKDIPGVARVEPAGSLRRGKETIGDVDILVAMKKGHDQDAGVVAEAFRTAPGVVQVLVAGDNKSSVRVALNHDTARWKAEEGAKGPAVQVDLRVLPLTSWGAALMYFTGSKEHNVRLRERANKMGLTLNEWGLFPDDGEPAPQNRGIKAVASATEEEIYQALGVPWVAPEMREDRGELDLKQTPPLIEVKDIVAELHAHTTASDGAMSIEELAENAKRRGFHTIAVTDHSKSSIQANGLSVDRLLAHIDAVRSAKVKGITILAGSEVDILADGHLDYDDDILAKLDVVIASPHTALSQEGDAATNRLIKAVSHKHVHILGHPTGRLINRRPGMTPDMAAVIAAAKEHSVALEVNAHWMRLDLRDQHVRAAVEAGCAIAINCDVHAPEDYDNLRFGVMTARRGWCPPDSCINTWPAKRLHAWLKAKRAAR
jgi:DNA polymerase (family 10)